MVEFRHTQVSSHLRGVRGVVIYELPPDGGDSHEVGVRDVGVRVHPQRHVTGTRQELVPAIRPER